MGKKCYISKNCICNIKIASNDIEFYSADENEIFISLKYNPISNILDVSKKENSQPSQGEQEPGESEDASENNHHKGADSSNREKLQDKNW